MFASDEKINLIELGDFIEKPAQECDENELKEGIKKVLLVLSKNPIDILNIISKHPITATSFLLDELAEKMRRQGCLEKLGILFNKYPEELMESCIFDLHDIERCRSALPNYVDQIMENIISNKHRVKRVIDCNNTPEETLKTIQEKYPKYKNEFAENYKKYTFK